jgi:hypothetical protein
MPLHTAWSNWFINYESNYAGNGNLQAFSNSLNLGALSAETLQLLVKEIDTVFLATNASRTS